MTDGSELAGRRADEAGGPALDRGAWVAAAILFGLHIAAKAPRLAAHALWLDEAASVHIAQRSVAGLLRASQGDTSPPVYYLLLAAFERVLGIGEAAVRWPSVLASGAAGAALFLLARRTLGSAGAWVASLLFLLSDVNLHYAREARPYALATFLAVVSFAAFLRFLEHPSWARAAGLAALNLSLVLTHYVTIFLPATQLGVLLARRREPRCLGRFLAASVPAAALAAVWLVPVVAGHQAEKMAWLAGPTHRLGRVLGWYASGMHWPGVFAALTAGAVAALALAERGGERASRRHALAFALWGTAPIAMAFLASFAWPCLHSRYLLYVTPGLALFWAAGVLSLRAGGPRLLGLAAACLLAGAGLGRALRPKADWRSATAYARAAQGERLLLLPSWEGNALAYYLDRAAFRDPERTRERLETRGVVFLDTGDDARRADLGAARSLVLIETGTAPRGAGDRARRALEDLGFAAREERRWPGVRATRLARE